MNSKQEKRADHGAVALQGSRRRFLKRASATALFALSGCGGSESPLAAAQPQQQPSLPPAPSPVAPPVPAPAPPSTVKLTSLSTLTVQSTQSGTLPYTAAVYPLEGAVPSGQTLASPDDPTLGASILSRWPDGSASVVVLAGELSLSAGTPRQVALRAATKAASPMTPARVAQLVTSLVVDCGSVGAASVANLAAPERTWWANERVICCRYRAPVGAHPTLEAVIDIHAFASNRALIEVVLENSKVGTSSPAKPAAATYSAATVRANGAMAATIQAPNVTVGGYTFNTHEALRAAYASCWIGGDPGVEVTHDAPSLQSHPLLFRCDQPGGSMAAYAADQYAPWSTGRHRAAYMGGGGDHPDIGPLPQWDAQYLQSGDSNVARAVVANALAVLTYNVNYRNPATGLPHDFDALAGKTTQAGFPSNSNSADAWTWEVAHHPAAGLMAFLCRPSPVFIEIAQKIAVWNGLWDNTGKGVFGYWYQTRGKAWALRSLTHAIFLTPDAHPWKAPGKAALVRNLQLIGKYKESPEAKLGFVWDYASSAAEAGGQGVAFFDMSPGIGFSDSLWQHHYLTTELHKSASAKLLSGADQTLAVTVADWAAQQPVRWVNESSGGEWRHVPYKTVVGKRDGSTDLGMDSEATWLAQRAWYHTEPAPAKVGPWQTSLNDLEPTTYSTGWSADPSAGALYPSYFWAALVAAVERGVAGADAAWTTVTSSVTGLSNWRSGFASEPRWGAYPRNR